MGGCIVLMKDDFFSFANPVFSQEFLISDHISLIFALLLGFLLLVVLLVLSCLYVIVVGLVVCSVVVILCVLLY